MKRICTVLKVIFGSVSGLGFLGVCSVNDASDKWFQTLIISFIVLITGLLLAILFDRLSTIKIILPSCMIYVMAAVVGLFDRSTKKSSHNRHRYRQNVSTKLINIANYLPNDEQSFQYKG